MQNSTSSLSGIVTTLLGNTTLLGIVIGGFIGGIFSLIATIISNRIIVKSVKTETGERQRDRIVAFAQEKYVEWLNDFKKRIAEYLVLATEFQTLENEDPEDERDPYRNRLSKFHTNSRKIRLHLSSTRFSDIFILREMFILNRYIDIPLLIKIRKDEIVKKIDKIDKAGEELLYHVLVYYKMLFSGLEQRVKTVKNENMVFYTNYEQVFNYALEEDIFKHYLGSETDTSEMDKAKEIIKNSYKDLFGVFRRHKELFQIFSEVYINTEWRIIQDQVYLNNRKRRKRRRKDEEINFDAEFFGLLKEREGELMTLYGELADLEGRKKTP